MNTQQEIDAHEARMLKTRASIKVITDSESLLAPWEYEPNRLEFKAHGLDCLLSRGPLLAWCGYVGLTEDHPLFGYGYDERVPMLANLWEMRKHAKVHESEMGLGLLLKVLTGDDTPTPEAVFSVHGGITYSARCDGAVCHITEKPDDLWWFGFDCSHGGDMSPGMLESRKYMPPDLVAGLTEIHSGDIYRTMDYCREQTTKLAMQLAAMAA